MGDGIMACRCAAGREHHAAACLYGGAGHEPYGGAGQSSLRMGWTARSAFASPELRRSGGQAGHVRQLHRLRSQWRSGPRAARMEQIAQENTILLTRTPPAVARISPGALPPQDVKGLANPLEVFELLANVPAPLRRIASTPAVRQPWRRRRQSARPGRRGCGQWAGRANPR